MSERARIQTCIEAVEDHGDISMEYAPGEQKMLVRVDDGMAIAGVHLNGEQAKAVYDFIGHWLARPK